MSLLIADVFESYYDGRKASFAAETGKAPAPKREDDKLRSGSVGRKPEETPLPQAA